ncbi:acyltransferase 3 [Solidesulfovibrio carbinoliphilus subsp. oakridgensis]|uniref:Acyltransferase 3 n=1 Tax=Solidesulfovibrio carbinoliphilus subsp. oakridgensis TaxID=694327 RepID=G7Q420_9BACT|nr:acyltransferase [Solidesulfovibrio carbinoliphilus]EHJ46810.1 acyltransferase 3 [Solidesulfovibrio carbinoliphilus subsp. oakridgensis]
MNDAVKPSFLLGPVREPIDRDVSKRIDILRIILIGLIVLAHGARGITVRIADSGGTGPVADLMVNILNGHVDFVAVPLFFTISGFLFLRKFELTLPAYGEMVRSKFISLLIPYVLFNGLLAAWFYCVGSIEMMGSWGFLQSEGLVTKILGLGTTPVNYPLWFLRDLLVVFLLSPVLLLFFKEAPGVGLITLFVLWAGMDPAPYSYYGDFFAFYLGGYLARTRLPLAGVSWWQRAGAWLFVGLTIVLVAHQPLGITVDSVRLFLFKCNLVLGLVFFWRISAFSFIRDSAVLHSMARHSFFVYLAHEPTMSILQTRLLAVWKPVGDLQQIAFYWLSGLTVIVLLWGLGEVLSRLVPAVYAVATGARRSARRPAPPLAATSGE